MFALLFGFVASRIQLGLTDERQFIQWMRTNNVYYTGDEYHLRFGLFLSNLRYINDYNRRNGLTFRLGLNKFSCYTPAEYKSLLGYKGISQAAARPAIVATKSAAPESYDWREKGVVNAIKDQASCGSCWAFSAISTAETAYAISTGSLLSFSEQNIVDCVEGCYGCSGGWPSVALQHVIDNQFGQFNSETDYPYKAIDQFCQYQDAHAIGKITSYTSVKSKDEADLKEKVASLGVASVCVAAGNAPFMSYSGGILDNHECAASVLDHAVACVGYGSEDGVDYWIVRNSWGTSWGEQGYVRMIRNKNNQCGIATEALVAID